MSKAYAGAKYFRFFVFLLLLAASLSLAMGAYSVLALDLDRVEYRFYGYAVIVNSTGERLEPVNGALSIYGVFPLRSSFGTSGADARIFINCTTTPVDSTLVRVRESTVVDPFGEERKNFAVYYDAYCGNIRVPLLFRVVEGVVRAERINNTFYSLNVSFRLESLASPKISNILEDKLSGLRIELRSPLEVLNGSVVSLEMLVDSENGVLYSGGRPVGFSTLFLPDPGILEPGTLLSIGGVSVVVTRVDEGEFSYVYCLPTPGGWGSLVYDVFSIYFSLKPFNITIPAPIVNGRPIDKFVSQAVLSAKNADELERALDGINGSLLRLDGYIVENANPYISLTSTGSYWSIDRPLYVACYGPSGIPNANYDLLMLLPSPLAGDYIVVQVVGLKYVEPASPELFYRRSGEPVRIDYVALLVAAVALALIYYLKSRRRG